jgi:secreted trypsin-like serine protease
MRSGLAAFGFFFLLTLVFTISVTPALAITWGQLDSPPKYLNVGAIMVHVVGRPADVFSQICSGTLIYPRVFLTAGHCTDYFNALFASGRIDDIRVSFDLSPTSPSATLLEVFKIITHPDYNFGPHSDPHDVGLLILKDSVAGNTPATLPALGFLDQLRADGKLRQGSNGAKFTVVGYGGILTWPPPSVTYEDQRRFAVSEYQALLPVWLRMSQNAATSNGGTCYGDSGGPTFWTDAKGNKILVAITSWGDAPCVSTEFNYRTDIPQTLQFIKDNLP